MYVTSIDGVVMSMREAKDWDAQEKRKAKQLLWM